MDAKNLDIELLVDRSTQMATADAPGGKTRWEYARETAAGLAAYAGRNEGAKISLTPFAGGFKTHESLVAAEVARVFQEQPLGGCNLAGVLRARTEAHFGRRSKGGAAAARSTRLLVMLGAAPDNSQDVADVVIATGKKMVTADELGITIMQVGRDAPCTRFLTWLDDELAKQGSKFGIVDTVRISEIENFSIEQIIGRVIA
jgi:hypothetical protein